MKYTPELTEKLLALFATGISSSKIVDSLNILGAEAVPPWEVSERSVIAKLSSLGVYKKKPYLTKRGETPVKKEEYIAKLAQLLGVEVEVLVSLEKVNKNVLALLERKLKEVQAELETPRCGESDPKL